MRRMRIEIIEGEDNLKKPSAVEQNTIEAIIEVYEKKNGEGSLKGRTVRLACRASVLGDVKVKSFNSVILLSRPKCQYLLLADDQAPHRPHHGE